MDKAEPYPTGSPGPPQEGGERGAALEFFLQLTGAEVFADVFEFLNVEAEGTLDVVAIGGQDVAPDLVGSHGETRHVLEAGPGGVEARRPAQLIGNGRGEGRGGELREVRGQGHHAIVL